MPPSLRRAIHQARESFMFSMTKFAIRSCASWSSGQRPATGVCVSWYRRGRSVLWRSRSGRLRERKRKESKSSARRMNGGKRRRIWPRSAVMTRWKSMKSQKIGKNRGKACRVSARMALPGRMELASIKVGTCSLNLCESHSLFGSFCTCELRFWTMGYFSGQLRKYIILISDIA